MFAKYKDAIRRVTGDYLYTIIAVSFALNLLALDYILLSQATTFRIMAAQNTLFYNASTILLSIITAILFGVSSAMVVYILKRRKSVKESAPSTFFGTVFAAVASGCPVCGAWLLPLLGIAGSLAAFPLQGLEIRLLAIGLLIFSIAQSTNIILGLCKDSKKHVQTSVIVIVAFIVALLLLPNLPSQFKVRFQLSGVSVPTVTAGADVNAIYDQVNPREGYAISARYGNIGYQLVQAGVIDFDRFSLLYERSGTPLTKAQLKIFSEEGSDENILINRENSYFLLNLFWAFGLGNDNPILTEGQITQYGNASIGDFASTGGWTIATKPLEAYYSKLPMAPLNDEQQARLLAVAENTYRPCCGNSTAFPDCNHGMALLGVLELMAYNNATEEEMFEAAKYFSAFWFPQQAVDVATLFMVTEGKAFKDIDGSMFLSEQFFSGRGWSQVRGWLESNVQGGVESQTPNGGGCGVESGAPVQKQVIPQGGGGCGV
tara:strand:- start:10533 stop:11999 length:1467 start_codon:yes stop_codon:yes gene_type:complete